VHVVAGRDGTGAAREIARDLALDRGRPADLLGVRRRRRDRKHRRGKEG
jgi:hypothetical protein